MQNESLIHVADFYSEWADYPLRNIRAGVVVVAGSDTRYKGVGKCCLWMAVMNDRAFVSTQHELMDDVRNLVNDIISPQMLVQDNIKRQRVYIIDSNFAQQRCPRLKKHFYYSYKNKFGGLSKRKMAKYEATLSGQIKPTIDNRLKCLARKQLSRSCLLLPLIIYLTPF